MPPTNRTAADARAPFSRTLGELLVEQASRSPEHPAVIQGEPVTFADLAGRAGALAAGLRELGVRRGDRVAALVGNRVEFLEVLFGATTLGAIVVPLSTWSTRTELEFLLHDTGPKVLLSLDRLGERRVAEELTVLLAASRPTGLERCIVLGGEPRDGWTAYRDLLAAPRAEALAPGDGASARDVAFMLYTSGSSSHPKAVPLDHGAVIENGFNIGERQGLGPDDRVFVPVPLFWSYGVANALPAAMTHRSALVVQERFEPGEALALIERHRCTSIYTLPAITSALLGVPGFDRARTRTLRTGLTIGTPQDVIRAATELGAGEICNVYGSTETYGNCCVTPHDWPLERRSRCQGPPLPGMTVRIRDAGTGAPCPPGRVGAIEVGGYVTRGYAGASAALEREAFCEDGFLRTGDLACLDESGCLVYAGRTGEMIKRSGINVSPAEIEEILQQHPEVGLAGVTGAPDEIRGESIVAFVVRRPGARPSAEALRAHCREHLSSYKLPDRIEFREALPLTPTGKLQRRALKSLAGETSAGG